MLCVIHIVYVLSLNYELLYFISNSSKQYFFLVLKIKTRLSLYINHIDIFKDGRSHTRYNEATFLINVYWTRMRTFLKAKLKKSDDQTIIVKYGVAAKITEYHIISKL